MWMVVGRSEIASFVDSFFIVASVTLHSVTLNVILETDDADVFFRDKA